MQLSTKARYAVRALIELVPYYGQGPLMLKEIARRQDISDKYLEQLMSPLRNRDIVYTVRGNRGGYMLSKKPADINLFEVIQAVEGSLAPVPCVEKNSVCEKTDVCATREVWCELNDKIKNTLENTTLDDLAERQREMQPSSSGQIDYVI